MATIKSQMVLNDGMSAVLKKISAALDVTLSAFEQVQRASGQAVDTSTIEHGRSLLVGAIAEIDQMADGYRRAAQEEERLNDSINRGASAMDSLMGRVKGIVSTLAGAAGVRTMIDLSDSIASGTARLSLVIDDGGSISELEEKIMASAQRSRASYLDTLSTVGKLGLQAGNVFNNNDEMIAFAELMNKNFVIAGASATEQASAMYQLTQAMSSGRLQGDEYRSIIENAPLLANAIEDYMRNVQEAEGSMTDWASEGLLTADVIKAALFSTADEVEARFSQMPMTWGQIWTSMQNRALTALDPVLTKLNGIANSEQFSTVVDGALNALSVIAALGTSTLDTLTNVGAAVVNNWSIIEPIVWGLVGALVAYNVIQGVLAATNAASALSEAVHGASIAFKTGMIDADTKATFANTAAQYGLNAALLACPITWIVIAVIALIAVFYAAVAAVNHFAGTSLSATGIICGAFAVAGAFIINLIRGVVNFVIGIGVELHNLIATFANFLANIFNDPVGAIINLFAGMFDFILGIVQSAASLIDTVLGTDMSGAVAGFRNTVVTKVEEIVGGQVEVMQKLDASDYKIQRIEYGDAWAAGNNFGKGIADKVSGFFGMGDDGWDGWDGWDGLGENVGAIADNTGAAADALEVSGEELKYLRDIAERDAINRFTTAEIKIDMTGMTNKIEGSTDLDGVLRELTDGFTEALLTAAEGVHA